MKKYIVIILIVSLAFFSASCSKPSVDLFEANIKRLGVDGPWLKEQIGEPEFPVDSEVPNHPTAGSSGAGTLLAEIYWNMRQASKEDIICKKGDRKYRYPTAHGHNRGIRFGNCN